MNRRTLAIVVGVATALCISVASGVALQYKDAEWRYSFTFPRGWVEIPRAELDAMQVEMAAKIGVNASPLRFAVGGQRVGTPYFTFPYFLVCNIPGRRVSLDDLAKGFESGVYGKVLSEIAGLAKTEQGKAFFSASAVGKIFVDQTRQAVVCPISAPGADGKKRIYLQVAFPCSRGVTYLYFYPDKSTGKYDDFLAIYDSLVFEEGKR